jgi:hypothetical protein
MRAVACSCATASMVMMAPNVSDVVRSRQLRVDNMIESGKLLPMRRAGG